MGIFFCLKDTSLIHSVDGATTGTNSMLIQEEHAL